MNFTRLEQLTSGYLSCDPFDPTATVLYLGAVEHLTNPFGEATLESGREAVELWRCPWLEGIDWEHEDPPAYNLVGQRVTHISYGDIDPTGRFRSKFVRWRDDGRAVGIWRWVPI